MGPYVWSSTDTLSDNRLWAALPCGWGHADKQWADKASVGLLVEPAGGGRHWSHP
jgi:hypothetical protein